MKEKTWRRGVIEKMEGHPVSATGKAKSPITVSDVYQDANSAFGTLFRELARFFGGNKAANRIRVGGSGGRRGRVRHEKKKGWF